MTSRKRIIRSGQVTLPPEGGENAASIIIERYRKAGLVLRPGNRIFRARDMFREVNAGKLRMSSSTAALRQRFADAHLTLLEHTVVSDLVSEAATPPTDELLKKIQTTLSGAESEAEDKNSTARDTQFELFVAALLAIAQIPVGLGGADLIIKFGDTDACVAVKRIRSPSQLLRRCREAKTQILETGVRGFVAVNLDRVISVEAAGTRSIPELFPALQKADAYLERQAHVLGRIAFARDTVWDINRTPPRIQIRMRVHFQPFRSTPAEERKALKFFARLSKGGRWRLDNL